jgi:hypothetical protein
MKVRDSFLFRGSFKVVYGVDMPLWEDIWLGKKALSQQFLTLYNIMQ